MSNTPDKPRRQTARDRWMAKLLARQYRLLRLVELQASADVLETETKLILRAAIEVAKRKRTL